jgi:DNA-binding transcriptional LysR family regulator
MLDVRQLRYFVTLAEHLHFGRAADILHVAQSALSTQILRLEADLGVALLNRRKRANVSLTEAGELFLVEALQSLRQIQRAERVGRLAARGAVGRIELGYVASAAINGTLANLLRAFRATNPLVEVALFALDTNTQLKNLAEGIIDAAIVRPRLAYPEGITTHLLHSEDLVLAVPAESHLASHTTIICRDLKDAAFIVPQFKDEADGFTLHLEELGRRGGFDLEPGFRVADFISALSLAAAGYGIVLLPRSFASVPMQGLVMKAISDYDGSTALALAWRQTMMSPALSSFIRVANATKSSDQQMND